MPDLRTRLNGFISLSGKVGAEPLKSKGLNMIIYSVSI